MDAQLQLLDTAIRRRIEVEGTFVQRMVHEFQQIQQELQQCLERDRARVPADPEAVIVPPAEAPPPGADAPEVDPYADPDADPGAERREHQAELARISARLATAIQTLNDDAPFNNHPSPDPRNPTPGTMDSAVRDVIGQERYERGVVGGWRSRRSKRPKRSTRKRRIYS